MATFYQIIRAVLIDLFYSCTININTTGVTIGLEFPRYTADEGDGSVEICAVLIEGTLMRTLMVNLSTQQNANAQGQYSER